MNANMFENNQGFNLNVFNFDIKFEIEDIMYYFGRKKISGPFIIIERKSGLCLETIAHAENGWQPWLAPVSGGINQQWILKMENNETISQKKKAKPLDIRGQTRFFDVR